MDQVRETIVIDNGSSTLKAGFAGSESPKFVFPSIVGQIQNPSKKKKKRMPHLSISL